MSALASLISPPPKMLHLLLSLGLAAVAVAHRPYGHATDSKYFKLGNLSPYHKAPVPHGVKEHLPNDCTVDQVMLVSPFVDSKYN